MNELRRTLLRFQRLDDGSFAYVEAGTFFAFLEGRAELPSSNGHVKIVHVSVVVGTDAGRVEPCGFSSYSVRGAGRAPVASWSPTAAERAELSREVLRVAGEEGL